MRTKAYLVTLAIGCILLLHLTAATAAEPQVQRSKQQAPGARPSWLAEAPASGSFFTPAKRPGEKQQVFQAVPDCFFTCNNGNSAQVSSVNAGDCACQCADFCGGPCTITEGTRTATCG